MIAGIELVRQLGGEVVEAAAIVDLPDLGGSRKIYELTKVPVFTICAFEGH
jgi:adenine phosphoribosyltransferase